MNDTKENVANDEITLVDILAVLLKYRWLIIGLTLAAALISGILFITVPGTKAKLEASATMEYETVYTAVLTAGIETIVEPDRFQAVVTQTLMSPDVVYGALESSGISTGGIDSNTAKSAALDIVSLGVKKNKPLDAANNWSAEITFGAYKAMVMNGIVTISMKNADVEKTAKFCNYLLEKANAMLNASLAVTAAAMIEYSGSSTNKVIAANTIKANQAFLVSQAILDSKFQPLTLMSSYTLSRSGSEQVDTRAIARAKIKKYGVLAIIGCAFLGIFLAFVFNWIESVKKDPVSMAKFREALGKKQAKH